MKVAVVGARGKTGRAVINALNALGHDAIAIGRAELADATVTFRGADAVYVIAPNMYDDEPGFVSRIVDVMHKLGITRIGYHSVTAPYVPHMPHHMGKAKSEHIVRTSDLEWTIIQPGAYVQNFTAALAAGELSVAYNPHRFFGLVDLVDVGEVAVRTILDDSYIGSTIEVAGPALVSMIDLVRTAGDVLGRDIKVTHITTAEWAHSAGVQLPQREREWLIAMFDYYEAHGLPCGSAGATTVLGREPLTLAETLRRELM